MVEGENILDLHDLEAAHALQSLSHGSPLQVPETQIMHELSSDDSKVQFCRGRGTGEVFPSRPGGNILHHVKGTGIVREGECPGAICPCGMSRSPC